MNNMKHKLAYGFKTVSSYKNAQKKVKQSSGWNNQPETANNYGVIAECAQHLRYNTLPYR